MTVHHVELTLRQGLEAIDVIGEATDRIGELGLSPVDILDALALVEEEFSIVIPGEWLIENDYESLRVKELAERIHSTFLRDIEDDKEDLTDE